MTGEPVNVTADFIFGTMATDDLRLAHLRREALGLSHRHALSPAVPSPGEPTTLTVWVGPDADADRIDAWYSVDGSVPTSEGPAVALRRVASEWDTLVWGYRERWEGTLPAQPAGTLLTYRLAATDATGTVRMVAADPDDPGTDLFAVSIDTDTTPDWLREAVIYHVFVDRFDPGAGRDWLAPPSLDGFWGGTLRGVIDRLPYLADLGVTCLWLSPVFPSPTHHGYDATDYLRVEPRLGTEADLVELFDGAHASGMRVILDFVANHLSDEHPAFREAIGDPASPERDWFTIGDDGSYRSFFGVRSMPQIRTDHPGARRFLIEAAVHWLGRGADGFRLDYANGPSHAFWAAFRQATRAARPDSVAIGEVVETAALQRSYAGRLDGTLDFLLLQQLRAFFAFDALSPAAFDAFLARHLAFFGDHFVLPSFLDNHDMNRFLWVAGGDARRLLLAALCQFTLPHPPVIYYGTEVGLSQWHDLEYPDGSRRMEEARVPMVWDARQDHAMLVFYRHLIALRRAAPDLWSARRTPLVRSEDGLYVVGIGDGDDRAALVALNRSATRQRFAVPSGWSITGAVVPSGDGVTFDGRIVDLPPWTGLAVLGTRDHR